jgi:hypothetical protein
MIYDSWRSCPRRPHTIATSDPVTAYVTAYAAARFAFVEVLAQQGLRATQRGGHLAVQQFGGRFPEFNTLRRRPRRNRRDKTELAAALREAEKLVDDATKLLERRPFGAREERLRNSQFRR